VRPGAIRRGTRETSLPDGVSAVGFEATEEEYHVRVLQLVKKAHKEEVVSVCSEDGKAVAEVTLPPTSITTARW